MLVDQFLSEIVTYKAYRKDLICIENEKMKKPRKSHPNKIINKECYFLGNARFYVLVMMGHIYWETRYKDSDGGKQGMVR